MFLLFKKTISVYIYIYIIIIKIKHLDLENNLFRILFVFICIFLRMFTKVKPFGPYCPVVLVTNRVINTLSNLCILSRVEM